MTMNEQLRGLAKLKAAAQTSYAYEDERDYQEAAMAFVESLLSTAPAASGEPTREMAEAFIADHDRHAAAKIPKIYAAGQRQQANVMVGLRAALAKAPTAPTAAVQEGEAEYYRSAFSAGEKHGRIMAALEASAPPAAASGEVTVRCNADGSLDEVVGTGPFHLEQMSATHWWMQLGPHMVNLHAKGRIAAYFGENEAAALTPNEADTRA